MKRSNAARRQSLGRVFPSWTTDAHGRRVRRRRKRRWDQRRCPSTRHRQKLADYIEEYTGRLTKQDRCDHYVRRSVDSILLP